MKQVIYNDKIDFSKCHCREYGFCPIFNRTMGLNPPDWEWCQRTQPEERQKYRDLLSKAPPSKNQGLMNLYSDLKRAGKEKWIHLYIISNSESHLCDIAAFNQIQRNENIINFIESQEIKEIDLSNIEILCLGHNDKQFATIEDRPYLTKINLNEIDAGKYSDNQWSESRAYISKNKLFKKDTDFIGFTTASWNMKYEYNRIDNFHNWNNAKVLLSSKPEDKIVLCGHVTCSCPWTKNYENNQDILSVFLNAEYPNMTNMFLKMVNLHDYNHINVPYSQQMIFHKSLFERYYNDLIQGEVFEKADWVYNRFFNSKISKYDQVREEYHKVKLKGYFMEIFTCFWFSKQDFMYIPNVKRKEDWYNPNIVVSRIKEWN
jgi:hypothetical protein